MAEHDDPHEHESSEGRDCVWEIVREGVTIMVGAASWAFEQGDRMVDTWLHQGHTSREEGRRRLDEFASNARRRGEDLGRRVQDGVRSARLPVATREQVADLERQAAELTREVEALKGGGASSPSERPQS